MRIFIVYEQNKRIEINERTDLTKYMDKMPLNFRIVFEGRRDVIGLTDVRKLLSLYKEMLQHFKTEADRKLVKGSLDFALSNRIKNFDLTFIAALNLVKFSFEGLVIRLLFASMANQSEAETCFFRFGQFVIASHLAYGHEIFGIYRDENQIDPGFLLQNLSGYLPFFYLNEESFPELFQESFKNAWDGWWGGLKPDKAAGLIKKSRSADAIYQELRKLAIANINLKRGNRRHNLQDLHIIYLFNACRDFHFIKRVLRNQLKQKGDGEEGSIKGETGKGLGIGLTRELDLEYENRVQTIFNKILEKPPAFIMLFSYFIESFYKPDIGEKTSPEKRLETRLDLLKNIYFFTDEIFYGVTELAKNIIEHSSNHRGVILGRALNREYLPDLKKEMFVGKYLDKRPVDEREFIDLIVLDDGSRGIIEQTIHNLKDIKYDYSEYTDLLDRINADIKNLETGNIILDDFFNPGEIKLNYQTIRSAMSVGLLILSHLVLENNGFLMVSSPHRDRVDGMALFENWQSRQQVTEIAPLGTYYNIIFPKNLRKPPEYQYETVPFEMPSGESAFNILYQRVIRCEDKVKKTAGSSFKGKLCINNYRIPSPIRQINKNKIAELFTGCRNCPSESNIKIISIDFKKETGEDAGELFRFLANIQLMRSVKSTILYNISDETVSRVVGIVKMFQRIGRKIGSNDHFVLFYYHPLAAEDRHYPFLLAGEGMAEICWINERLSKTGHTGPLLIEKNEAWGDPDEDFLRDFYRNPLFTRDGHLLPFDVLIQHDGLSLFERNVQAALLAPGRHPASPSYTFKDAHIRLGSKIHLEDFFYARRIFQDSFYSLRFALLVSRYIEEHIKDWLKPAVKEYESITVLGYGLYSELLISHICRFLTGVHGDWKINHASFDDSEDLKTHGEIKGKVIIIIPISYTLSTSHKIVMKIEKDYPAAEVIGSPISILVVGSGEMKNIIDQDGNVIDPVVGLFWKRLDINKKIIVTRSPEKEEKFFLYLPSTWYLPLQCPRCFPDKPADETVLFETDKVSVNPTLIYTLPNTRENTPMAEEINFAGSTVNQKNKPEAVITDDMLLYHHTTRGKNHYLYYIEYIDFLKKNKESVKIWLKKIKRELTAKKQEIFDSRVILIAPTHYTNSDFISLVNEIIFSDTATLFHYDQDEDYIKNIKTFFDHDMTADAAIFFVDDVILGGSTFDQVNNFIKYTRGGNESQGADGAFILLNRLMEDKYRVIVRELAKYGFFAFADLQVPSTIDSDRYCYLCAEKKRYEKILSETILDSLRILIRKNIMKLMEKPYKQKDTVDNDLYEDIEWKYLTKEKCRFGSPENQGKYHKRLEYVHHLYLACSDEKKRTRLEEIFRNNGSLEELCRAAGISCPVPWTSDDKVNLIKILSYPFFVYHQEIRKYIFKMVIRELEQTQQELNNKLFGKHEKNYLSIYRYLKFLIRRAALLKANYLIRDMVIKEIFSLHHQLCLSIEIIKTEADSPLFTLSSKEREDFQNSLNGFIDYYLLAIKETIWFNEARSLKLEEILDLSRPDEKSDDAALLLLKHSLRIENISIPLKFVVSLEKDKELSALELSFTEQQYDEDLKKLSGYVIALCQGDPYRAEPMLDFLGRKRDIEETGEESQAIRAFLENNKTFQARMSPMFLLKAFFLQKK
ncbi:MAG: hypothetical protein L0Y73_00725, partial [Candidatus Aminicenantes bacterium]|nr:hypothetical protein [Candidatus Aminicenantes bacterium]